MNNEMKWCNTLNEASPKFMTIRAVARTGLLTETALRRLNAKGQLPGFRSGNRFLVNCEALQAMIDDPNSFLCAGGSV